jgi:hypothetical protein
MRASELYSEILEDSTNRNPTRQDEEYEDSIGYESDTLPELFTGYVRRTLENDIDYRRKEASETLKNARYDQNDINSFLDALEWLEEDVKEIAEDQIPSVNTEFIDMYHIAQPFIDGLVENYEKQELVLDNLDGFSLRKNSGKDVTVNSDIHNGPYDMKSGEVEINGEVSDEFAFGLEGGKVVLNGNLAGTGIFTQKGGEVIVEGDAESNIGHGIRDGQATVKGDAKGNAGSMMSGGELVVEGNVEGTVGEGIEGGQIYVEGDAKAVCANSQQGTQPEASGGEIRVEGEIEELAEENLQGVEVYQRQAGEWVELTGGDV